MTKPDRRRQRPSHGVRDGLTVGIESTLAHANMAHSMPTVMDVWLSVQYLLTATLRRR